MALLIGASRAEHSWLGGSGTFQAVGPQKGSTPSWTQTSMTGNPQSVMGAGQPFDCELAGVLGQVSAEYVVLTRRRASRHAVRAARSWSAL